MTAQRADRRVQRTRQLLQEALVALILERGYEAVTVQAILDRANLGRSTFYAHYRSKDELLLSGFEHLRSAFEALDRHGPDTGRAAAADLSLALFRHAASYQRVYTALVGRQGGALVLDHVRDLMREVMREHLAHHVPAARATDMPLDVAVEFLVSAFLGLLTWWLDHDLPYPPERMDALFKRLTLPGLEVALGWASGEA